MQHRIVGAIVGCVGLLAVLTACGGGSDEPATDGASTPVPAETSATSAGPNLPGVAANADLTAFTCTRDASGVWNATGTLLDPVRTADYRVTVLVAPLGTDRARGKRQILPKVQRNKATPFTITKIPVTAGDSPTCRVQVVRFD